MVIWNGYICAAILQGPPGMKGEQGSPGNNGTQGKNGTKGSRGEEVMSKHVNQNGRQCVVHVV